MTNIIFTFPRPARLGIPSLEDSCYSLGLGGNLQLESLQVIVQGNSAREKFANTRPQRLIQLGSFMINRE